MGQRPLVVLTVTYESNAVTSIHCGFNLEYCKFTSFVRNSIVRENEINTFAVFSFIFR